ncbi:MAG: RDD family protein [Chloroflexi bacterium]|nr:RDD family protein [Chloroflexota bacterium]
MTDRLATIQRALDDFRRDEARALVKEELKENPSADAYYLAAQAARTEGDRVAYLRKALEIDLGYQAAVDELAGFAPMEKVNRSVAAEADEAGKAKASEADEIAAPNMRLASIGKRWLAIIIDGFIVGIATVLLLIAGGALAPLDAAMASGDGAAVSAAFSQFQSTTITVNLIVSAVYNVVLMVSFNGQTLGKMMLRLRVVKRRGGRIKILDALLRNVFGYTVSQIFLLGYLWALFDREKQAWHDKMAGTVVVEERRAVSA